MKKFVKSFFLAASALLLLASCNNLGLGDASVDALENEGKAFLTFSIGGVDDSAVRSAARTINPTAYTNANKTDGTFKIKLDAVSESLETVTVEDISKNAAGAVVSTYTVELTYDVWYITLSAIDDDKVVMQDRKRVDLTKGVPSTLLSFDLSSKGVTTPGAVSLTATYTDNTKDASDAYVKSVTKITCGLYTVERNEVSYRNKYRD